MTPHERALSLLSGEQGGFSAYVGEAYCHGDSSNRRRLEAAFPELLCDPAPRVSDFAIDDLLKSLNDFARCVNNEAYGLPMGRPRDLHAMVRDWLQLHHLGQ